MTDFKITSRQEKKGQNRSEDHRVARDDVGTPAA